MDTPPKNTNKYARFPSKDQAFKRLNELGVPVETVLDVGVLINTYELAINYSDKLHVLMEPVEEFEERIRKSYDQRDIQYLYVSAAMSDTDGTVNLTTTTVKDGTEITHARMTDNATGTPRTRTVPSIKLDTLVEQKQLKGPFLLKIDVDGAEEAILRGAQKTLPDCSIVCVEAGPQNFLDRAKLIVEQGFRLFDIVDFSYYDRRFAQMDLLFLSEAIIKDHDLEVYKHGFDYNKWFTFRP